jgi:hypothetical protein
VLKFVFFRGRIGGVEGKVGELLLVYIGPFISEVIIFKLFFFLLQLYYSTVDK